MTAAQPKVLAVDGDRALLARIAQAFNDAGLFLRYVAEPRKVLSGLKQLRPDLLLIHDEVRSEQVSALLQALARDVTLSTLPVALICTGLGDRELLTGLRTGVVALLAEEDGPGAWVGQVKQLLVQLPGRPGAVRGRADTVQLTAMVEHLRRTARTGLLLLNPRQADEGSAAFVAGRLDSARFLGRTGVEALVSMVAQPSAEWSFTEMHGSSDAGASAVIEVQPPPVIGDETGYSPTGEDEPLTPFEVPSEAAIGSAIDSLPLSEVTRGGPAVLLVDDDASLCEMFSTLLRKHGYAVTTASDGLEGFQAALRDPFDLVIADLNMPRMDGWGLLRLLRDDARTRELPLAFLSCHDDYRDSLKALDAGAQAYFSKGTRLDALVQQLRELLAPREQVRAGLDSSRELTLQLANIGAQWLVRELCVGGRTGRLEVRDSWATYQLMFRAGNPVHAAARAGRHSAEGERAFNAFVASKGAEGTFTPGKFPSAVTLNASTDTLLGRACATLNHNEQRLREGLLIGANQIEVNAELYAVYDQVGPRQWLSTARLICEEKLSPREVLALVQSGPSEVEEALADLIRRGVITLRV